MTDFTPRSWIHTGFAQRVMFGDGALSKVAEVVKEVGARRVLLVTTEGRLASESGEELVRRLGRTLVSTYGSVTPHNPVTGVQAAVRQAKADGIDGIVSFGGGSCADAGKAVAYFLEQMAGTPGSSYVDRTTVPHVSIPTTYSGAELTPFFGMTDEATRQKQGAGGPTCAPIAAIYDPILTLDTPIRVSAETGMNALAHGVECAWSQLRSPEAEAIALACIRRVAAALPLVVDDPVDIDARRTMLEGAALGGRCLQNASMGIHHGMAQLVGGRTGVPHGLANAVILAPAIRFNQGDPALYEALQRIGEALGDPDDPAGAVDRLRERIGLPARLSDAKPDLDPADLDAIARMSQSSRAIQDNPRPVTEDDARELLTSIW